MSILSFVAIGVGLILLSIGIYFATRKLVMRSMFKGAFGAKLPAAEPLYETPMPKAQRIAEEKPVIPEKNPLLEFIDEWEEPKPAAEPKVKPTPPAKKTPEAEKPASKTEEAPPDEDDNPLLKYIEEWEEPKAAPKKK